MTCFWTGLLYSLKKDYTDNGIIEFIKFLKLNNCKTENIIWNNEELNDKLLLENQEAIKEIDSNKIYFGYDCSTCDPVLILICHLFNKSIEHIYNGVKITYINKLYPNNIMRFSADNRHFWHVS